jgi:hypothetical protein
LLNTIIALNPDTFSRSESKEQEDRTKLYEEAMRWSNPVLAPGNSRTKKEEATQTAMNETATVLGSAKERCSGFEIE